jgi:anion-transporting  ArsA/GET3 family ATPase
VSAALAAASSRRGRKTLLYEFSANDRFGDFFGASAVGTEIVKLREHLHAVNTNPAAAIEEYGLMVLRFRRVYEMVFENRVTKLFLRAVPGLDEYSILGKAWWHTTETDRRGNPIWETLIFDMAASGHSVSMLHLPQVILDTVPEGPLTRDARKIRELLVDPTRTSILLVTLAEEMPANEARELSQRLARELDLPVTRLLVNQVYPDQFPEGSPQTAILDALGSAPRLPGDLAALAAHGQMARRRRRLNERYLRELSTSLPVPMIEIPLLFSPSLGPPEIATLSHILERELG